MFLFAPPTLALTGRVTCSLGGAPSSAACSAINGTEVQATGYNAGVRTEQLPAMRAFLSDASTGQWQRVVILGVGLSFFLSHNTGLVFHAELDSKQMQEMQGHHRAHAGAFARPGAVHARHAQAPTTDLDTLSLVKIDVESGEYELLPHLIAERPLRREYCTSNGTGRPPGGDALSGLALMLSLHHTLKASCTRQGDTAPILIVNEESPSNNGLEIPGLRELVPLHSAGADSELGAAWHKAHKAKGKGKGKGKGRGGVG